MYALIRLRTIPADELIPARYEYAYSTGGGSPHAGVFTEDELDREIVISTDGTTRTGQQILDEAGVTLD